MTMICDTYREAAAELSRPFTPEAIRWKVQALFGDKNAAPTGGLVVAYIDAGLVVSRLNLLVPHLWHDEYQDLERGMMRCRLTIDGIVREDVGEGATLKARYSDSLKRAAVKFGVGVSLRRIPRSIINAGPQAKAKGTGDKRTLELTQPGLNYLRDRYHQWLTQQGIEAFGQPLNHGDTGEAQGDEEAEVSSMASEAAQAGLLDELTNGQFTLKQQRGYLLSAGVPNLPLTMTPQQIAAAVESLTEAQAENLQALLNARAGRPDHVG